MPLYTITTQEGVLTGDGKADLAPLIRTGRSPEYKRGLLTQLWQLLQQATEAPDDQIVIGIQEAPPSQAMKWVRSMPDVAVS